MNDKFRTNDAIISKLYCQYMRATSEDRKEAVPEFLLDWKLQSLNFLTKLSDEDFHDFAKEVGYSEDILRRDMILTKIK